MLTSTLNPNNIINKKSSSGDFGRFMLGQNSSSSVEDAANKIVNFSRSGVSASSSNLSQLISNISKNILSQVDSTLQTAVNFTKNDYDGQIQNLRKELESRLATLESGASSGKSLNSVVSSNSPVSQIQSTSLRKSLDSYKTNIEFINYFGNKKNIEVVRNSLRSLREIFTETFDIAKVLRETIVKIVKQLSNLPSASPNSGGLNLDVNIPGANLKKAGGSAVRNVSRGANYGAMAGLGLLGAGTTAAGMMSSGAAKAQQYQDELLSSRVDAAPSEQSIPEGFVNSMMSIIDKFSSAIEGLIKGSKSSSNSRGGGGSGSRSKGRGPSPSGEGELTAVSSAPRDEKLAAFVASMEASSPENAADALQVMLNRSASGKYGKGLAGVLSGFDQFSPISAAIFGNSEDPDARAKYGPIASKIPGNTPNEKFKYLQQEAEKPDGFNRLQKILGGGSPNVAGTILNDPKYLEASRKNVKGALNFGAKSIAKPGDVNIRAGGNYFYNFTGPVGTLGSQPTGKVTQTSTIPTPTQTSTITTPKSTATQTSAITTPKSTATRQAARAQTISKPAQQTPTTITLPPNVVNIGGGQEQSQASPGGIVSPPSNDDGGTLDLPALPTGNPDNFLTMYSRIVYNIVDG